MIGILFLLWILKDERSYYDSDCNCEICEASRNA